MRYMCSINKSIDKAYIPVIWFIQQQEPNHSGNAPEPCEGINARKRDRQQSKDGKQISETRSQGKVIKTFYTLVGVFICLKNDQEGECGAWKK